MSTSSVSKRVSEWWGDHGSLWYAAIMFVICLLMVPLAIYGIFVFLKVGWLLTAIVLLNTVLAMMMLSYAAPMASTEALLLAILLWLYGLAQLLLLVSAAIYGAVVLVAR